MTENALIMCREPGRHSTLDKGHEEGGSAFPILDNLRSDYGYSIQVMLSFMVEVIIIVGMKILELNTQQMW